METENKHPEGPVTEHVEDATAKVPSIIFLYAALAAMGISLTLKCLKRPHTALFVGQWAAPFLLFGVYDKIVKTAGHDENG